MQHKWYVQWRHRDRAARGRLMTLWRGSRTVDSRSLGGSARPASDGEL